MSKQGNPNGTPTEAWTAITFDQGRGNPLNWIIVGFDGKPDAKSARVVKKGYKGLDEFTEALTADDASVLFGGLKVKGYNETGNLFMKYVFFTFIGKKVKPVVRAGVSGVKPDMEKALQGMHIRVDACEKADIQQEDLEQRFARAMNRPPKTWDWSGSSEEDIAAAKERGEDQACAAPTSPVKSASPPASPKAGTGQGKKDGNPAQAWAAVRSGQGLDNALNWIVVGGDGKEVVKKGNKGLDEFKAAIIDDDHVHFGGLRVKGYNETGNLFMKYVFVTWIGKKVKPIKRAQVSGIRPDVEKAIDGTHIRISASEPDDILQKDMEQTLARSMNRPPKTWDWSGSTDELIAAAGSTGSTGATGATAEPAKHVDPSPATSPTTPADAPVAEEPPAAEEKKEEEAEEKKEEAPAAEEEKKEEEAEEGKSSGETGATGPTGSSAEEVAPEKIPAEA